MLVDGRLAMDAPIEELRAQFWTGPGRPSSLTDVYMERADKLEALELEESE